MTTLEWREHPECSGNIDRVIFRFLTEGMRWNRRNTAEMSLDLLAGTPRLHRSSVIELFLCDLSGQRVPITAVFRQSFAKIFVT